MLPRLAVLLGTSLAVRRLGDFDTWWHLASGRWIVAHHAVPATDTLSFTVPDHAWVNLQWLFDVLVYGVYSLGGAPLLVLASALGLTVGVALLVGNVRSSLGPITASLLTVWTLVVVYERFVCRPEILSFIYMGVVLWLLLRARSDEGRRLWWLVPVMLLWVNSHSLFVIGAYAIVCAMLAAGAARIGLLPASWRAGSDLGPSGTRRMLAAGAAACAVTVVNPFGLEGMVFPFRLWSRINGSHAAFQAIGEFRRPFSGYFETLPIGAYQWLFFFSVAVVALAVVLSLVPALTLRTRKPGEVGEPLWIGGPLIFAGLAYISLMARRNIGIFAIGAVPLVAASLQILASRLGRGPDASPQPRAGQPSGVASVAKSAVAAVLAAVLVMGVWLVASNRFYRWDDQTEEFGLGVLDINFPIAASEFVADNALPGKLFNDLTAGGYLTWTQPVPGGVFIDGRLEVYNAPFFTRYMDALAAPRKWGELADTYGIQTVLLFHRWGNRNTLIRALASSGAWQLVYYDEVAIVFVRVRGNEDRIQSALAAFPRWSSKTHARLTAKPSRWQVAVAEPVGRMSYANLLATIGQSEAAAQYYELAIAGGLSATKEIAVRIQLAGYYYRRREIDQARLQLRRALDLDPDNARLRSSLEQLGG